MNDSNSLLESDTTIRLRRLKEAGYNLRVLNDGKNINEQENPKPEDDIKKL